VRPALVLRSFGRPPWPWLFALAGLGLVLSATGAGHAALPAFCGAGSVRLLLAAGLADTLGLIFALNPPGRLLAEWAMMLLAMMPLLLAAPLVHVWRASLPRRRLRALSHFVLGYGALWMAAGPLLLMLALLLRLLAGETALAAACLLAAAWSASPWQRIALNRGHRLRRIGLFGRAADRDCLAFGAVHGAWCVASCWAWMLVPLAAGRWHVPAMILTGAVMLGERLAAPGTPRWRLPAFLAPLGRPLPPRRRLGASPHG
jgi:hypothetical protein